MQEPTITVPRLTSRKDCRDDALVRAGAAGRARGNGGQRPMPSDRRHLGAGVGASRYDTGSLRRRGEI
jgi:hypothetical protein